MSLKATCAQTLSPVGAETRALASVCKLPQELLFSSGSSAPVFGLSAPRAFGGWSQDACSAEAPPSHHVHPALPMGTWMHREAGNTPSHTAGPRTGSAPLPDVLRCKPSYHSRFNLKTGANRHKPSGLQSAPQAWLYSWSVLGALRPPRGTKPTKTPQAEEEVPAPARHTK